jgi:hypothetical protein
VLALAKANSVDEAIHEAEKLKLTDNHLYHSLLARLYETENAAKSLSHLQHALALARTAADKAMISKKITMLVGK